MFREFLCGHFMMEMLQKSGQYSSQNGKKSVFKGWYLSNMHVDLTPKGKLTFFIHECQDVSMLVECPKIRRCELCN